MWRRNFSYFLSIAAFSCTTMCRKPFESPAIQASNHFIVIGGIINTGASSRTTIAVTKSLNLLEIQSTHLLSDKNYSAGPQ